MNTDDKMIMMWKLKAVRDILQAYETAEQELGEDVCFLLTETLNETISILEKQHVI